VIPTTPSKYLIICSNKWFSAVSDYCLQFVSFLKKDKVIFLSQPDSVLQQKINFEHVNKITFKFYSWNFYKAFIFMIFIHKIIKNEKLNAVYVFESREHNICVLHKILFNFLWQNTKLIRIRGQDKAINNNLFNKLLYSKYTNKVIFVANIIKQKSFYHYHNSFIQYYCKQKESITTKLSSISLLNNAPNINFDEPSYLLIARYDPIKGHEWLLNFLASIDYTGKNILQFIFIGESKNIKCSFLINLLEKKLYTLVVKENNRFFIQNKQKNIRFFLLDEYYKELLILKKSVAYGIISSVGSEVICRVAVEFLEQGVPLLSTKIGALPEILNNSSTLWLNEKDNIYNFDILKQSINIFNNKKVYNNLQNNCQQLFNRYSLEHYQNLIFKEHNR